jgi:hypothetical protein
MTEAEIVPTGKAIAQHGAGNGNDSASTPQNMPGTNTYGCLEPIEIDPLTALLDDIKRTFAHIMWLEHYIATLPADAPFSMTDTDMQREMERSRVGKPTVVGSVKWQLEMQRRRQTATQRSRPGTHPAVTQLLNERKHLNQACQTAIVAGIKLDAIDYSRKQADLIVTAMGKFAISQGLNPADPATAQTIVDALEAVLNEQAEQA